MGFHIKTNLQRAWSLARIPAVEGGGRDGFVGETIRLIAEARHGAVAEPAHDRWRFPDGEFYDYDSRRAYAVLRFLDGNASDINRGANLLADNESRAILKRLLAFRALGPKRIAPPKDVRRMFENYRRARECRIAPSDARLDPFDVARYRVSFEGHTVELDCWLGSLVATFFERQYYFERAGVAIGPRRGDIVLDSGACFGDTALAFAVSIGGEGAVHSFEPMPRQRRLYQRNRAGNPDLASRLNLHEFGLDSVSGRVVGFADAGAGAAPARRDASVDVATITIDDFVERAALPRVDFIKMDIEGAEARALTGARGTIRRFRPRLAISAYHSLEDLVGLAGHVRDIEPCYRLYLDHHSIHAEETVLYATAD